MSYRGFVSTLDSKLRILNASRFCERLHWGLACLPLRSIVKCVAVGSCVGSCSSLHCMPSSGDLCRDGFKLCTIRPETCGHYIPFSAPFILHVNVQNKYSWIWFLWSMITRAPPVGEAIESPYRFFFLISVKLIELSARNLQYLSGHQLFTHPICKKSCLP